ncbi:MAG: CocE/NonD family hydrolase [Gemmatimonadota bacterium]
MPDTMLERAHARVHISLLLSLATGLAPIGLTAQAPLKDRFEKRDVMIPTRDGVQLHTEIYIPKAASGPMPFMLTRTPYGVENSHGPDGYSGLLSSEYEDLANDGYIIVLQDIRGRFTSTGQFEMLRPPRRNKQDPKAIDESTDTYDTIEWLLKNVPNNNGRAGMMGISYMGWTTVMGMLDPHPALKAVAPQASPEDMYIGDDFHHNGAFRLSYAWEYAAAMEASKRVTPFKFPSRDTYQFYLDQGPLISFQERHGGGRLPSWVNFVKHPNYDAFWKRQAFAPYLTRVTVPTLNVAGWWDQEDFFGPIKIYELLEQHDTKNQNFLVVGPWNHGGWGHGKGDSLGKVSFGAPTSAYYRKEIEKRFFDFYLKDKGTIDLPEALTFETGGNQWKRWAKWPAPPSTTKRKLYFRAGGKLSFDPPSDAGAAGFDQYVSDPANPVPYRPRPIDATFGPNWPLWQVQDQRFLKDRKDVLTFMTDPLTEDVVIAGSITGNLFASTSGTDSDWIIKLIDAYPESNAGDASMAGFQLMIVGDVLRGRFAKSFETPAALVPNQVTPFTLDLHSNNHRFLKGHRIMVQVQSSWFPIIDRNPQTFMPSIFDAKARDFRSATQKVYRTSKWPSNVAVTVVQ